MKNRGNIWKAIAAKRTSNREMALGRDPAVARAADKGQAFKLASGGENPVTQLATERLGRLCR